MKLMVLGAGGHAKVVVDAALAAGIELAGVVGTPTDPESVLGMPVFPDWTRVGADAFIVAVGDNFTRERLFSECIGQGLVPASVIHPSAIIGRDVLVEAGSFVAAGVVVNSGTRIGADAILNTGCTIDHDCVVGNHAHVGPGAHLCGGSHVGAHALIGVGACAAPRATIGEDAIVGAGAAVTREIPAGETWAGVPARRLGSPGRDGS